MQNILIMLPYINFFKKIPTYSLATAVGVLLSLFYLRLILKRHKELEADAELALLYGIVGAFVGAKLLYLATVLPEFLSEFNYLFTETELFLDKYLYSGFVFYGGLFGAMLAVILYCLIAKVDFSQVGGILLPVLPLIHGFGRVGCFCMGCCYGKVSMKYGISFQASQIAPDGIPLIPVQLYEAFVVFMIFGLLVFRAYKNADGICSIGIYLLTYGVARFILEFWRGDAYRGFIGMFSVSQVLSMFSFAVGTMLLLFKRRCTSAETPTGDWVQDQSGE